MRQVSRCPCEPPRPQLNPASRPRMDSPWVAVRIAAALPEGGEPMMVACGNTLAYLRRCSLNKQHSRVLVQSPA